MRVRGWVVASTNVRAALQRRAGAPDDSADTPGDLSDVPSHVLSLRITDVRAPDDGPPPELGAITMHGKEWKARCARFSLHGLAGLLEKHKIAVE